MKMTPVEEMRNAAIEGRRVMEWLAESARSPARRQRMQEAIDNIRNAVQRYDASVEAATVNAEMPE